MHAVDAVARRGLTLAVAALLISGWLAPPAAAAAPAGEPAAQAAAVKTVDINQANEDELATIPGIGKEMAKRIVDFRQQNGPYARVDDLLKVKGIGEKSLEKLRPHVKVAKTK